MVGGFGFDGDEAADGCNHEQNFHVMRVGMRVCIYWSDWNVDDAVLNLELL